MSTALLSTDLIASLCQDVRIFRQLLQSASKFLG
jgi:hypothetical protein